MKNLRQFIITGFVGGLYLLTSTAAVAGITDNADKTKDANQTGQMINTAVGALNLNTAAACFQTCPHGCCSAAPIFLLMGLQNMAQSGAQGKTAGQARNTVGLTDIGNSGYDPNAVKELSKELDLKKGLDFVASMTNVDPKTTGFSYNPSTNTVTAANGKTLSASDVNSAAAMEAAGVSKSVIDTVTKMSERNLAAAMKKVSKHGTTSVNSDEGGEGGSGSSSGSTSASAGAGYGDGSGGAGGGLGIDRDPSQVAGMQKNYNGEPIGVSADSIFKMMTRRYKTKENQNNFIDDAELLIQK
jgi:uncharacterized membrane protein YgcG